MSFLLALLLLGGLIIQVFIPGFPKETLLIQSGANFGILGGMIINWSGMVIGAQLAYEIMRNSHRFASRFVEMIDSYNESYFAETIEKRGIYCLFLIRLIPYAPNDILSLLSGALLLPRFGFILVSMITALPYAFIFAYIGYFSADTFGRETVIWINLLLMVVSILALLIVKIIRQSSNELTDH